MIGSFNRETGMYEGENFYSKHKLGTANKIRQQMPELEYVE